MNDKAAPRPRDATQTNTRPLSAGARARAASPAQRSPISLQLLYLVMLARPRTWFFASSMWLVAYLSTGVARPFICLIGVLISTPITAVTNLFNIYTDRAEDAINLPECVRMVNQIGLGRFKKAIAVCYLLPLLLALAFTGLVHTLVWVTGILDSVFYSWGLRLKAHVFLSLAAMSGVIILPFLAGWVLARPLQELSPIVLVYGLFFFAYGNLKNLPEASGDRQAGVRTVFTLHTVGRGAWLVFAMLISPYVLLALLVWAGLLPSRHLLAFGMIPLLLFLVYRIPRARTVTEKEYIHALGYFYQVSFYVVALILYYPTLLTALSLGIMFTLATAADYFKVDSRPYDLNLRNLLGT